MEDGYRGVTGYEFTTHRRIALAREFEGEEEGYRYQSIVQGEGRGADDSRRRADCKGEFSTATSQYARVGIEMKIEQ